MFTSARDEIDHSIEAVRKQLSFSEDLQYENQRSTKAMFEKLLDLIEELAGMVCFR